MQVVLYNRADPCCTARLNKFIITVGDSEIGIENQICVADGGDVADKYEIINDCTPPIRGRYVLLMVNGRKEIAVCEIQVYGSTEGL